MQDAAAVQGIESKFRALDALMDERMRRQWAAAEAQAYGWGGIRAVSDATGISPNTIRRGLAELELRAKRPGDALPTRIRAVGGGRKCKTESDPGLLAALEALVDPATRGDPDSPLRWTSKSTRTLARQLTKQGHSVSDRTVGRLLRKLGYSLQGNRKTKEGDSHVDRNAQFEYINNFTVQSRIAARK
jgi:transposase